MLEQRQAVQLQAPCPHVCKLSALCCGHRTVRPHAFDRRQNRFTCDATSAVPQNAVVEKNKPFTEFDMEIGSIDPQLQPYEDHFTYRQRQFLQTKESIEQNEGSLAEFAKGYEKLGFTREGKRTIYREWAPMAQSVALIGDFNNWEGSWMEKDQFGVWSICLPDNEQGQPAVPHGSRVKVRLQHPGGWFVDRIPAWIKWSTVEPGVMGAKYDGIFWDPPPGQRHQWKHKQPKKPEALRIYEAHVGISSEVPHVASYTYFKDNVLPRIAELGYNAVQLMAIQEHAYYASFGYHVTSPFAVSSRSGNPEELKTLMGHPPGKSVISIFHALVDEAHRLGLCVLLDVVHSHISSNTDDGLAGLDFGDGPSYFCHGERGYHSLWDSRLFDYSNWETLRYLLSNLRWWLEEYRFDGFRFDGVTSMLYQHHGIHCAFSGEYSEYFSPDTNVDAVVYLMLANELVHSIAPQAITVAEDVSGMPGLGLPVEHGGVGFDYRLGMGLPDLWAQLIKDAEDGDWKVDDIVASLCNRRYTESTIAYVESHDQCLVGDQTLAWRLMGAEMYDGMSAIVDPPPSVERGCALHKMLRLLTMALGGEGWLGFMGNEFGHPEWLDFPRAGNNWSYHYCRRQWSLVETEHLRYRQLNDWDREMQRLDAHYGFLSSPHQLVSHAGTEDQVIVAERGSLVFVFNFSPSRDFEGYKIGAPEGGRYEVVLSSDDGVFGGRSRIGTGVEHFSQPEGIPGQRETNFNDRPHSILIAAPSRTAAVYALMAEGPTY